MIYALYLYLYGVFSLTHLFQTNGKKRKIHRGDLVMYHNKVWVVKRKRNGMVNLLRRMVSTGPAIWVPEARLKHANESGEEISLAETR